MEKTKINALLELLAKETGKPNDLVAARTIFKSITHGMRDSLSIESSIEVLTALPPYLKELFIEDWKPSKNPANDLSIEETFKKIHYYYSINSFPPATIEIISMHYKKVKTVLESLLLPSVFQKITRFLPEPPKIDQNISFLAA